MLNTIYLTSSSEMSSFLSTKQSEQFHDSFMFNGEEVHFFGLIDYNEVPPKLEAAKFSTNLSEANLVMLDVLIEFATGKDITNITSISLREIDNYLRDNNSEPAFSNNGTALFPLFDSSIKLLSKVLETENQNSSQEKSSPTINKDYKHTISYFPFNKKSTYPKLSKEEKLNLIDQIIKDHISRPLKKDNGSIECVFADDNIIAIEYFGACRSCNYSLTSTLNFIQKVFQLETKQMNLLVMTDS